MGNYQEQGAPVPFYFLPFLSLEKVLGHTGMHTYVCIWLEMF